MFRNISRALFAFFIAGCWLANAASARAEDRYYLIVFAFEGRPNLPRAAHTFATFIKVQEDADSDAKNWPVEHHTISWVGARQTAGQLLLRPVERGANLDLPGSFRLGDSLGAVYSAWGPFEIKKELYDRGQTQIDRLNSGAVAYKALDARFRPTVATNCFHAVSDIVDGPLLDTGTAFGEPASRMVMQHLSPSFIEPSKIHRQLTSRIGLDSYRIAYRDEAPVVVNTSAP